MKKWLVVAVVVAVVSVLFPLVAFADDEIVVDCSLTLAVVNPGVVTPQDPTTIHTTGEVTKGTLVACTDGRLDGPITTVHDSEIVFDLLGGFIGELKGSFSVATADLGTLEGTIEADIVGVIDPISGLATVTDTGEWELSGEDIEGSGTFGIVLVGPLIWTPVYGGLGNPSPIVPLEPGAMAGTIELDDDSHDDDRDSDGDDDDSDDDDDDSDDDRD